MEDQSYQTYTDTKTPSPTPLYTELPKKKQHLVDHFAGGSAGLMLLRGDRWIGRVFPGFQRSISDRLVDADPSTQLSLKISALLTGLVEKPGQD